MLTTLFETQYISIIQLIFLYACVQVAINQTAERHTCFTGGACLTPTAKEIGSPRVVIKEKLNDLH